MSAMLAIGSTGVLLLAALNLLTFLLGEFSRRQDARRYRRGCGPLRRRPLAARPALSAFPPGAVDYAVAAHYARHHLARTVILEDGPGAETLTPTVLRTLLGSPGDGTVARFDAEGGFSEK